MIVNHRNIQVKKFLLRLIFSWNITELLYTKAEILG
jgi:hypothetical protein